MSRSWLFLIFLSGSVFAQGVVGKWILRKDTLKIRWAILDTSLFRESMQAGVYLQWRTRQDSVIRQKILFTSLTDSGWEFIIKNDKTAQFVWAAWSEPSRCNKEVLALAAAVADKNFRLAMQMGWAYKGRAQHSPVSIEVHIGKRSFPLAHQDTVLPLISGFEVYKEKNRIMARWKEEPGRSYIGYRLFRTDSTGRRSAVTEQMITPLHSSGDTSVLVYFRDTITRCGKYQYHLIGVDPFGENGPVSHSNYIELLPGKDDNRETPVIDSVKHIIGEDHTLFCTGLKTSDKFLVLSGHEVTSQPDPLRFIIKAEGQVTVSIPQKVKYIRICLVNGDSSCSFPFYIHRPDTVPPPAPEWISGRCDHMGMVRLEWKGAEAMIFRLFRANSIKEEFVEVGSVSADRSWMRDTITMHSLSPYVYYFLRAVDSAYNNSGPSDTLRVERTDTIPPPSPSFLCFEPGNGILKWGAVFSTQADDSTFLITQYADQRCKKHLDFNSMNICVTDTIFKEGSYRFYLLTRDPGRNESVSDTMRMEVVRDHFFIDSIIVDRTARSITLFWSMNEKIAFVKLFRGRDGEPESFYRTLPVHLQHWTDTELYMGNRYRYRLMLIRKDGSSLISDPLEVEY